MAKKTESVKKQAVVSGKRLNAFSVDPAEIVIIGLDTKDGPEHYLYDERIALPLPEPFVKNVRVNGVLETILIQKDGDRLLVVNGRQRVRAAREANRLNEAEGLLPLSVPIMLKRGEERTMMGIMITTNEHRQQDEMATKLKKLERLLALGNTEEDAALQFGVSVSTIKNWLTLLEAGPAVKKAFTSGQLSASAATKFAKLPREEQAAAVEQATADGVKPTAAQAGRVAKAAKTGETAAPAIAPPSKKLIKAVLVAAKESDVVPWETLHLLEWVLGERQGEPGDGLSMLLARATAKKPKRSKAVAPDLEDAEDEHNAAFGVDGYAGEELLAAGEVDEEEMDLQAQDSDFKPWDEDPTLSERHA